MKLLFILSLICLYLISCEETFLPADFVQFQEQVNRLEEQKRFEEALLLTKSMQDILSDYHFELIRELAYIHSKMGQTDKVFASWAQGHELGFFFFLDSRLPQYSQYANNEKFSELEVKDRALRAAALELSSTIYEVREPYGFCPETAYPLLIVLHGGGSNLERVKEEWQSEILQSNFLTVFPRSYLHYDTRNFGWRSGDERLRNDLKLIYEEIRNDYRIQSENVIIAGISAGGSMALDLALNQVFPITGFLVICPGKPTGFSSEAVRKAAWNNLKGVMIGGENDFYLGQQKEMSQVFQQEGLPCRFSIISELGHGYPDDFESHLANAWQYLTRKATAR
ncbi:MAG: alpha/beta hydrolase [Candidatus Cloacimonetes bacterium]|nr:alpha/beta hydrolase [Candidatus Cloacimonadota bacterium]